MWQSFSKAQKMRTIVELPMHACVSLFAANDSGRREYTVDPFYILTLEGSVIVQDQNVSSPARRLIANKCPAGHRIISMRRQHVDFRS
jgi:hypothetical protein